MNVAIFVRVSTLDQKNNTDSVETHIERGKMYAKSKGWKVVKIYNLAGVSGKSTIKHKQTLEMFEDVKTSKVQGIIISSLSRLARNTSELLEYSKFFETHNASLISINESLDTSTSGGKFFYTLLSALTTYEREITYERQIASLNYRRSQGKFTGGQASYGFKIVNAQLEINDEEAPVRRLIYDLFIKHQRTKTVAKILNDKGYQTRKGRPWSDVTIKRLLKNTDAKGMRKFNYRGQKTKDNPTGMKPQSEWEYLPCPTLVTEEIWEEANAIILEQEKMSKSFRQPLNKRVHLFTSYLKCEQGHKMSIKSKSDRYTCKECKYGIHKEDLEEVFLSRIKQFLISDEELSEYNKSNIQELNLKTDEIEFAKSELDKLEAKLDKLIDLNIKGEIPTKGFKKHYDPVFVRKENLEANIKSLELELEQLEQAKSSFQIIANKSIDFYNNWQNLDRGQKRDIVEMITNEIIFDNKTILFKLKQIAPLSFLELSPSGQQRGIML
ncbi:recombinase family protein [Polaribacter sp. Z022]|uniref:recombinase family protein n=1 Tax=Polaribacter sp. Z022 TaxID=2927125 RepID=UPI0020222C1B|nr:recombinase family protein [Polaribacter sp. Z022]MCL7752437.1 recombinase family protein [Polaribacter sp. Z022]